MDINSFYASVISPFLRKTTLGERIDMAFIAFHANLQFAEFLYANSGSKIYSDSELENIFTDLDIESLNILKRFMHRQYACPHSSLMVHPKYFYTDEEKQEQQKLLKDYNKTIKKFHLPRHLIGPESIYYHHGLRFAPHFIKDNIKGKNFADIGGWLGDSTLIFTEYNPNRIVIFEPEQKNRINLQKVMAKNRISNKLYELQPFALSNESGIFNNFECKTLDELSQNYQIPFGVLKADIEGMGLRFLLGAKETIKRDRPLLTLSIYHNEDEFIGIYKTLKEWNLNYIFEIKSFQPMGSHGEISLLAYPEEWKNK